MRFMTIRTANGERPAIQGGEDAVLLPDAITDLIALVEMGEEGLDLARKTAQSSSAVRVSLASADLAAPIRRFRRDVLCCGWNYWDHFEESKGKREGQDVDRPVAPTFFTKAPDTVIGPYDAINYDERISKKWDYEAEIALVIGRSGRSIPATNARDHIFGVTLANDVSQRDLQRRHGGQWLKGKSIDGTMPIGPVIVTMDEINLPEIRIECVLNGTVMQSALVKQMAFPVEELIAELSFGMTLHAGDLFLTGTPSGIGNAREPPVFLKENDRVVVRATGVGELDNVLVVADLAGRCSVKSPGTSSEMGLGRPSNN
jgi:2-keto-4-pentenoate hydratase/2-oxohepta-3-ene-1,7-dioic acid hydratase in catechol pathway